MIYYYIPDFVYNLNINLTLLNLMKHNPEMFYDDVAIGAVFGNFPNCIWNGGTRISGLNHDMHSMLYISHKFNSLGVPLRLTMTNPLLEERDLYDRYSNYIMENLNNGFNQVLVSSPILEEYIRSNYPEYPIVRSILASEHIHYDDSDRYYMSVLRRHKNNDFELLNSIKNKDKIEILVNEFCDDHCPRTYTHYLEYAKQQLYQDNKSLLKLECNQKRCPSFKELYDSELNLSREKIKSIYEPLGFRHFKLAGRATSKSVIHYSNHLVKPEYKDDFFSIMIEPICADNKL